MILFYKIIISLVITSSSLHAIPGYLSETTVNWKNSPAFKEIYVVKNGWHTGLVFKKDSISTKIINALTYFQEFDYIDFGWGDADFYQHPGFDLILAAKAILIPTPSVVRVEGFPDTLERAIAWRDYCVRLRIDTNQYKALCQYIESTFSVDVHDSLIVTSGSPNRGLIFFKSPLKYHLFMTCNTWVAKALKYAGLKVDPFLVITAYDLYYKIIRLGEKVTGR